ncbi:hypothetical protein [Arthrobacter sp. A5]|uniref:hypothetical protein n=1 Tax=Arthrobacter sp. A5 TaxID=576926 RepID=UPI003DA8A5C3
MDAAAEAWFIHMSRFSSDIPVHLGLRKAVEQVAEGSWRSLEEDPTNMLAQMELILRATRNSDVSPLAAKFIPPMNWSWEIRLFRIESVVGV